MRICFQKEGLNVNFVELVLQLGSDQVNEWISSPYKACLL